ncbi:Crp/Fnr family transcriptional regulator [Methylovorus menthalis]|uniref:Crp/Fnr family transcriptional regulator n=1 Tax=Methylovorus menthalis TaxID=1002227 RepID=UPI001E2D4E43|nr:Crp/Fnr family transcriptional regulator [Methylovorus menthalis]MCB4811871.1 Crp/Fnr family transcriptional regulator [Methylovorus menthalis]
MSITQVKALPLLQGLPQPLLEEYYRYFRMFRIEKKNFVCHKGDEAGELFFLLSGRLMVVDISAEGRQTGLSFISPGDYFGELSVLDDLPRAASILAVSESLIAALPKSKVNTLVNHVPKVAERMLKDMCHRMRVVTDFRCLLGVPNAYSRVFLLISRMASNQSYVEHFPSHQQVAIMVNTSRETVSRALGLLVSEGVVEKESMRLVVKKPETLNRMASDFMVSSSRP